MIMEAMYNGRFYPAEMISPKDPKHKEIYHQVSQITKELSEKLSREDMASVMALRELLFQAQDIELESHFAFGFAAGILLHQEVVEQMERVGHSVPQI